MAPRSAQLSSVYVYFLCSGFKTGPHSEQLNHLGFALEGPQDYLVHLLRCTNEKAEAQGWDSS